MRVPVSFIEKFLHAPDKLAKEDQRLQTLFWEARSWHPVVQINWLTLMDSDGQGCITYADGSKCFYEVPSRPPRRPAPTPPQDRTVGEGGAS